MNQQIYEGQYIITKIPRFDREPVLMKVVSRSTKNALNNPLKERDKQYLNCVVVTPRYANKVHVLTENFIYNSGKCTLISKEAGQKQERLMERLDKI